MSMGMLQIGEVEEPLERRLWRAVIASTVDEWVNGPLRRQREAEQFLFTDSQDYRTVCFSAGIDPADFRRRLERLRSQSGERAQARHAHN